MRTGVAAFGLLGWLWIGSTAPAQTSVFFQEEFSGPTLDSSVWRTEILTSGSRWCDWYPEPGYWVDEGSICRGVAASSPYGSAILSDGSLHLSSSNGRAFPYLVSRFPGATPLFPASGDLAFKVRMHFDRTTPWGTFLMVVQTASTDPAGDNDPFRADRLLQVAGEGIYSALDGPVSLVAGLPSPTETHEVSLACVGNRFTIRIDGQIVYGPVTSSLRPNAVWMGNPAIAYWYPTDWTSFSVEDMRVELPGPPEGACCFQGGICLQGTAADCLAVGGHYVGDGVPCHPGPCGPTSVDASTWGRIKASYRE